MRILSVMASIVALGAPVSAQSQSAADSDQTLGAALAGIGGEIAKMSVDYCVNVAPPLKPQLEFQLKHFMKVSARAVKPILKQLSRDPEFSAPVPADVREQLRTVQEMMLQEIKKADPNLYCQSVVDRMSSATTEGVRSAIESKVAGYIAAAKQRSQPKK